MGGDAVDNFHWTSSRLTYICVFDLGEYEKTSIKITDKFLDLYQQAYSVSEGTEIGKDNSEFIDDYQYHFVNRIKPEFRKHRKTIIMEFGNFHNKLRLKGLTFKPESGQMEKDDEVIVKGEVEVPINFTLNLNDIGIGCLSLWIDFTKIKSEQHLHFETLFNLRDPRQVWSEVNFPLIGCNASVSLLDLTKMIICLILKRLYPEKTEAFNLNDIGKECAETTCCE